MPAPELLAPAGDEECLRAALAAGADAVYLGLDRWSARAFAGNFGADVLPAAIDRAHLFGARVHLALNTLLKEGETDAALAALEAPYLAGLDAVLVADLGLGAAISARYPELELHASTQLGTHSSPQLALLARLGFKRAVLARELSLDEIGEMDRHGLDLEVFVHGALCYGYSGACLFSSMVGGRSGNRGRCAQACRMRYRLTPAGEGGARRADPRESSATSAGEPDVSRVLSAADLAAVERLPELLALGIRAFKIEGRMKDAGYVATAVSVYREALDAALSDPEGYEVRPEWWERLEEGFSRTFTTAHLDGRHDEVRNPGRGGHRGVLVGRVESVDGGSGTVTVRLSRPLEEGDLITVYTSAGQTEPRRVKQAAQTRLRFDAGGRVGARDRVFRVGSAQLDELARDATAGRRVARPLPLTARFHATPGAPAELTLSMERPTGERAAGMPAGIAGGSPDSPDASGEGAGRPSASATSRRPLETARTAALTAEKVRDAVGALGGTPYTLADLHCELPDGLFLPVGELKDMRRRAVAALDDARLKVHRRPAPAAPPVPASAGAAAAPPTSRRRRRRTDAPDAYCSGAEVPVILRLPVGAAAPDVPGLAAVCLDVGAGDAPADVEAAVADLAAGGLPVRCRPPQVLFDRDLPWWEAVAALPWEAVYARHAAHLRTASAVVLEYPLLGLSSGAFEVLRSASAAALRGAVASPELTLEEVTTLVARLETIDPTARLEILAFGRQDVLLTRDRLGVAEGLVDASGAGPAEAASPACGRGSVELELRDARDYVFPVCVDSGGSRIRNARVTNLSGHLVELCRAGVGAFIVEHAALTPEEAEALAADGPGGLASFDAPGRSTTAHLFRGVA